MRKIAFVLLVLTLSASPLCADKLTSDPNLVPRDAPTGDTKPPDKGYVKKSCYWLEIIGEKGRLSRSATRALWASPIARLSRTTMHRCKKPSDA